MIVQNSIKKDLKSESEGIVISHCLYTTNNDNYKIYNDKIVIYQNCGIFLYKEDEVVAIFECTNIEIVDYKTRIDIFGKSKKLTHFALSVILDREDESNTCNFKKGDKVIRQDNFDAAKISINYLEGKDINIEKIKKEYEYEIIKIINITNDFKILEIQKDNNVIQVNSSEVVLFNQLIF